jgi:ATP-binding cassette subfamily B protein
MDVSTTTSRASDAAFMRARPPHEGEAREFVARVFNTDKRGPLRFVGSHIRRHPIYAIMMVIGAFANAALAAAVPYFIGIAFNAVVAAGGGERALVAEAERAAVMTVVVNAGLAVIASQLLRAGLQLMRNFSAETFAQRVERDVRDELYASLLGKSMSFHDSQPVGEIMARVTNDVRELNLMMNPGLNLIIGSGFFLITPVFAALGMYPPLALTPALFLIAYAVAQALFVRQLSPNAQAVRERFGVLNTMTAEALDGLQVVKGAAQETSEQTRFDTQADSVRASTVNQARIEATYPPFLMLWIVIAAGLTHSLILFSNGEIPLGTVIAFNGQLALFGFPVWSSLQSFSQVSLGYASARRILEIINTETALDQNADGHSAVIAGAIRFENVDFGYPGSPTGESSGKAILHGIDFSIEAGQTIALVGQTGSGKSTIAKLLNRTYDVNGGAIRVDGVDVRTWNMASLRSQVSIIEQDIYLFSRSIADNIRFGKPDAGMDEVIEAAKKAQAHEFITGFPEGYETVVGQRGVTLSGGQRQRLALARAFITNPPILVLDDSTSAIDSATEDRIQQAIWAAADGRTMILITHRLSQIRWADHIIVLKNGRVAAQGGHDALMASSEDYRRIFARYQDDGRADAAAPAAGHAALPQSVKRKE